MELQAKREIKYKNTTENIRQKKQEMVFSQDFTEQIARVLSSCFCSAIMLKLLFEGNTTM